MRYEWSGIASGHMGELSFFEMPFELSSTSNTDDIYTYSVGHPAVATFDATLSVSGVGQATFTGSTINIVSNVNDPYRVGIAQISPSNLAILFAEHPVFATYGLDSEIGPVVGLRSFNPGILFETTAGLVRFTFVQRNVTFQAKFIPEPSSAVLAVSIFALCGGCRSRR